jgi:hypothetical protein
MQPQPSPAQPTPLQLCEAPMQRGPSKPSSVCTLIRCTTAIEAGKHNSTMEFSSAVSRPFEDPPDPTSRSFAFSFNDSTSLFALRSTLQFLKNPICHGIYHRRCPSAWQRCGNDSFASKQNDGGDDARWSWSSLHSRSSNITPQNETKQALILHASTESSPGFSFSSPFFSYDTAMNAPYLDSSDTCCTATSISYCLH